MIDMRMRFELFSDTQPGSMFIRHQMCIFADMLINKWLQLRYFFRLYGGGPNRTAALDGHEHSLFFSALASLMSHAVLKTRFAPYIFLIQFNNTGQHGDKCRSRIHHFSDCMGHFPRALLGNPKPSPQYNRRDSLAEMDHI